MGGLTLYKLKYKAMTKTILIPIDFTVASLNMLKLALEDAQHESVHVILMYSEFQSDSITDLLFYSETNIINEKMTPNFTEALEVIKNRFEKTLLSLNIKVFHAYNIHALNVFLKANRVDVLFLPKNYKLAEKNGAFDPVPLLRKSDIPAKELEWSEENFLSIKDQLHALFTWIKQ
jgi:hypothetical protein